MKDKPLGQKGNSSRLDYFGEPLEIVVNLNGVRCVWPLTVPLADLLIPFFCSLRRMNLQLDFSGCSPLSYYSLQDGLHPLRNR
jgi:hypothetical protein